MNFIKKIFDTTTTKGKVIQIILCLVIAFIVYGIIALIANYKDYTSVKLNKNTNSIFTITDLSVRNLVYGDLEDVAITDFGKPNSIEKFKDGKYSYKTYYYTGLSLTFKKVNGSYILMKTIISSENYIATRSIRVNDKISDVMNKFLVENTTGDYLYGNYKESALSSKSVNENIYYGKRESKFVYYLYMDTPYKQNYATWKDDIAQITFKVKHGKVQKIEWMYGPVSED